VAMADRALILECLSIHRMTRVYFFSNFREAELMQ
jgi:hypothetical protein